MTSTFIGKIVGKPFLDQLQSKGNFDNVKGTEIRTPEVATSGVIKNPSSGKLDKMDCVTPILPQPPNLYKQTGEFVSYNDRPYQGHVTIPRSLLDSDSWRNLTFRHKSLFLYLLEKVRIEPKNYDHHGKNILIYAGQYCITYRRLVDEYNKSIKFKKEHIDVPFLQRAVSLYNKFMWTDTTTDTGIMIITITQSDIYEHYKKRNDTYFDTKTIQDRYTNEERKNERIIKETIDRANAPDSSPLDLKIKEKQKSPSVFLPQNSLQNLTDEKKNHYEFLWKFVIENSMNDGKTPNGKPGIKESDLASWIKIYEGKEILECLKMTLKTHPKRTWAGYATQLLKDRIPKKEEDSKNGKKYVEDFIKKNKIKHLEIKQDYFKDLISQEQSYYNLPQHTLEAILNRSAERAKEREEEDKIYDKYEDNY